MNYTYMKFKLLVDNEEQYNLVNKTWIKTLLLVVGSLSMAAFLIQVFCLVVKPKGYEIILQAGGGNYVMQFVLGFFFFSSISL